MGRLRDLWVRVSGRRNLLALSGLLLGSIGSCTLPSIKPPHL